MIQIFQSFLIFVLVFNNFVHSEQLQEVDPGFDALITALGKGFDDVYYNESDILDNINLRKVLESISHSVHDNNTCHICLRALPELKSLLVDAESLEKFSKKVCKHGHLDSEQVCLDLLERMGPSVVYIIQNTKLTDPEVCSTFLHPDCMEHFGLPMTKNLKWELSLPDVSKRSRFRASSENETQIKILQLTDLHLDLNYKPEANVYCGEPLCCRTDSSGHNLSAGYWGELHGSCDFPLHSVDSAFKHIKQTHKDVDYIFWTGDTVPHEGWTTSKDNVLASIKSITDLFKHHFNDTKIYPCLGNHDTHPYALYVPHEVSLVSNFNMSWLYNTLADDYWHQYLTTDSKHTFKKGGFYSTMIRDNIKLIVLNNNVCYKDNYWRAYDPVDQDGQLQWLIDELDSAEEHSKYAIIIGHIPASGCFVPWEANYIRIMDRYQHLIVGTYWGHNHQEEVQVFYNKDEKNVTKPVSVAYVSPSLTPFTKLNPGYRVFTLDSTGKVLDFDSYYTNITEDNILGSKEQPVWKKGYSAKESYGLESLSPESWDKFITKAKTDDKLTELYVQHYHRFSEVFEQSHDMSIEGQRALLQSEKKYNPYQN